MREKNMAYVSIQFSGPCKCTSIGLAYNNEIEYFRSEPDLEFEGLLKRQHTRAKYFQGSLMNAMDLERAKVISHFTKKGKLYFFSYIS